MSQQKNKSSIYKQNNKSQNNPIDITIVIPIEQLDSKSPIVEDYSDTETTQDIYKVKLSVDINHSLEYIQQYLNHLGLIKLTSKNKGGFQQYSNQTSIREISSIEKSNIILYFSYNRQKDAQ